MGSGYEAGILVVSVVTSANTVTIYNDFGTSLKNHGADDAVDKMFMLGEETMALPLEERMKFEQGDDGMSFGCISHIS